jgi:hypothetical protein
VGVLLIAAGCGGAIANVVGSTAVAAQESSSDASGGTYEGTASADGVRVTYEIVDFVVADRLADGGVPVAQAVVSSVESVGFASAPYPGDVVISAPGLAAGASGAPIPDYPLVASSQHPVQEEQSIEQGVVRLQSKSTATSSSAVGAAGGPDDNSASVGATRASADVVHDEATGVVTSTAASSTSAFTVAGVFRIGRVSSTAKVVDSPDGDPKREFSTEVGEITVVGQTVALTNKGLALPGSSTPLPDDSPLAKALSDQGIEVRRLAAEETPDGIIAPGVEVRMKHPVPNATSPGVVVYRFGQAAASARGGLGSITVGGEALGGSTDLGGDGGASFTPPAASGAFDSSAGATSAPLAPTAAPTVAPTRSGGTGENATLGRPELAAATPQWDKAWSMAFYIVIVIGGLVAVGGAQLIRLLGVRMPWTS